MVVDANKATGAGATGEGATSDGGGGVVAKISYTPYTVMSVVTGRISYYYGKAKSFVYDAMILRMTERWYRAVLERLDDGSILLDAGVGTGGALLRCTDLIEAKDLKIIGIDIDSSYVETGKASVLHAGLSNRITIEKISVYEGRETIMELAKKLGATEVDSNGKFVDAVYFSGSFSLLPDPIKALQLVSTYVKKESSEKGTIYITQTYQRKTPFFLPYVKPLMKYVTSIDFGQLVREEDVLETFRGSGLEVVEHDIIEGSVDNSFQAAYLSILR